MLLYVILTDGFSGSYSAVKKYVRKLKGRQNIFVRIHTVAAVLALLQEKQLGTSKHYGTISLFDREFIKRGVFDQELSKTLPVPALFGFIPLI